MMFVKHNQKCPVCEKGKLIKTTNKAEEGVYVDAFRCTKCKEIFYSENVMRKMEALQRVNAEKRNLVRVGNSLAAIIPAKIVKNLHLREKEQVFVEQKKKVIVITLQ
jgi:transposase-like protein